MRIKFITLVIVCSILMSLCGYYKYKVKSNIILIDYGCGYGAAYFIVDGGVFSGNGFHKSK